jgi:DNA polymerase-3 subunit epsilon
MLQAEYKRLGQPPLNAEQKTIVDAFRLWQRCEPRSLMDAHRRFVGEDFEQAHSALADVAATTRVLRGMLSHFDIDCDWQKIAGICEPARARWVGPSHHVQWLDAGPALTFGRHSGKPLTELAKSPDGSYLKWMLGQDFPDHVHEICRQVLALDAEQFAEWLKQRFGSAPQLPPQLSNVNEAAA